MSREVSNVKTEGPSVIPVSMPNVNWGKLLAALQEAGLPRVTQLLDTNTVEQQSLPALTLVLSQVFNPETDSMVEAIKNAGHILQHTHVTFMVQTSAVLEIVQNIDLKISAKGNVAFLSESLDKWRLACVEGTKIDKTRECRIVFNKIIAWLGQGSFTHLFWGYRKVPDTDGVFALKLG